jgi:beta-N-acetylhexosaminidase
MQKDLTPYRLAIANRIPLIMLSNAAYTAWDPANGAGWSRTIVRTLLRTELGYQGVTITDSLSGAAKARGTAGWLLAAKAANAGTDFVLLTGSEASTADAFDRMLAKAELHQIDSSALKASYARILALKAGP